jgi:uncharacterized membrane protein YhaH (DUF805 family)
MNYYTNVINKYAVFEGRATRKEYWMFVLINFIITICVGIISTILFIPHLQNLYSVAVLLPSIAVGVRRLHDINHSGWWLLLAFIPIIGWIWLIILLARKSDTGPNDLEKAQSTHA